MSTDIRRHDSDSSGGDTAHDDESLNGDHRTDQALAAEQRFGLVVEAAPSGMVMVDQTGAIVMVNTQAERMFGYSRDELLGQPVEILVPPRYRGHHPGLREAFQRAPQARPMGAGRELFGLRKDGGEFPVEIG